MNEELELSNLCRKGNNNARRMLYERYSEGLYAICLRYLGDSVLAQDLLHDGFLKIFNSFNKFTWRGEGSLRAWMSRIMVNEVLLYIRNHKNNPTDDVPLENMSEPYEDPDAVSVELVPNEVLFSFVKGLPKGYRTVFNLYVFEEKSHKEIGELLGINEKSSASQLFRAKKLLAERINEWIKKNR